MMLSRLTGRVVAACLFALASAPTAAAQTWTGATNYQWNVPSNWSSNPSLPSSGFNTNLLFGTAPSTTLLNNIPGTFGLNRMMFNSGVPAYIIFGNALEFANNSSSAAPTIFQNSANPVTIGNNLVLTNTLMIDGTGIGTLALSGALSGAGGLNVSTLGSVILGNGSNSFGGTWRSLPASCRSPTRRPSWVGRNVTVRQGAVFRVGAATGGNAAAPIGLLGLSGGTF
jgi:hypothetical protein